MVHALRRAGRRLRPGGILVSIQPHRTWRPLITLVTPGHRTPVVRLINPAFDRSLRSVEAALDGLVHDGLFTVAAIQNHRFRIRLENPSQLRAYIDMLSTPRPRFPAGGRARLLALWDSRPRRAWIEVIESLVVTALRSAHPRLPG